MRCRYPPGVATPSSTSLTASISKAWSIRFTAKPATSLILTGCLPMPASVSVTASTIAASVVEAGDDFDQLHPRDRREIMGAKEIRAAASGARKRRASRSGWSRCSTRGCRPAGTPHRAPAAPRPSPRSIRRPPRSPGHNRTARRWRRPARPAPALPLPRPVHRTCRDTFLSRMERMPVERGGQCLFAAVVQQDIVPAQREDQSDLRSHQPGADHARLHDAPPARIVADRAAPPASAVPVRRTRAGFRASRSPPR